jgi:hypothetical protein
MDPNKEEQVGQDALGTCLQIDVAPKNAKPAGLWGGFLNWLRANFFKIWPQKITVHEAARELVGSALQASADTMRSHGVKNAQMEAEAEKALSEARHEQALAAQEESLLSAKVDHAEAQAAEAWAKVRVAHAQADESISRARLNSAQAMREMAEGLKELKALGVDIVPLVDGDKLSLFVTSAPAEDAAALESRLRRGSRKS